MNRIKTFASDLKSLLSFEPSDVPPLDINGSAAHIYLAIQGRRAKKQLPALVAPRLPTGAKY